MMCGAEWYLICGDYLGKEAGKSFPKKKAECPGLYGKKTTVSQGMEEERIGQESRKHPRKLGYARGESLALPWHSEALPWKWTHTVR